MVGASDQAKASDGQQCMHVVCVVAIISGVEWRTRTASSCGKNRFQGMWVNFYLFQCKFGIIWSPLVFFQASGNIGKPPIIDVFRPAAR